MPRTFAIVLVFLLLLASPALAVDPAAEPVQDFNQTLLQAMQRGKELGFDGRAALIRPAFEKTFAWRHMARVAAGRHWAAMSEADKERYQTAYRDWSVASYADRFHTFRGQRFEVLPPSPGEQQTMEVVSRLHRARGEPVDLTYRLRQPEQTGQWLVVDVQVRGVSQLALTRAQFVAVLDKDGLPALLAKLKDKAIATPGAESSGEGS